MPGLPRSNRMTRWPDRCSQMAVEMPTMPAPMIIIGLLMPVPRSPGLYRENCPCQPVGFANLGSAAQAAASASSMALRWSMKEW